MFKRLSRNNSQPLLKEQFIKFRGFPSPLHKSDVDLESLAKLRNKPIVYFENCFVRLIIKYEHDNRSFMNVVKSIVCIVGRLT